MLRLLTGLMIVPACAHTPTLRGEAPAARVATTTEAAGLAPAVIPAPMIQSAKLGCGAHGGDGDHTPLSRYLELSVQLTLSDPGELSIQRARWSLELAGRPIEVELGPTPVTLTDAEPQWLSGDRFIAQDQGEALEQGVRSMEEREPVDVQLELDWTRGEESTSVVRSLSLRPSGCFELPPQDDQPLEPADRETMDPSAIMRVMAGAQPAARHCWERALDREPTLRAIMSPSFTIASDGSVRDLDLNCEACDSELTACLEGVFAALRFPPPPNGGTVKISYPWHSDPAH